MYPANQICSKNVLLMFLLIYENVISERSQNVQNVQFLNVFIGYANIKGTFHLIIFQTLLLLNVP